MQTIKISEKQIKGEEQLKGEYPIKNFQNLLNRS